MKKITNIIIHCSDSEFGSASEIRRWHLANKWDDIGYHFVITNGNILSTVSWRKGLFLPIMDGALEIGRYLDGDNLVAGNEIGAHALGYNETSIGICLIGVKKFTPKQFVMLINLLDILLPMFGLTIDAVKGHYEVSASRTCPNFDMVKFRESYKNKTCSIDERFS